MIEKNYTIKLNVPDEHKKLPPIRVITSSDVTMPIINIELTNIASEYKNEIDNYNNTYYWDKAKKKTNPYELIHIPHYKNYTNHGIALNNPISRSYFKLMEMIHNFNIIPMHSDKIVSVNLAEGPGGFIEAIAEKRNNNPNDKYFGITLKTTNKFIPSWKRANEIFKEKNLDTDLVYGSLYSLNNINAFYDRIGDNKADIVTGDGGFDYSKDFNKQEQMSYRLIFSQIVMCLKIQKIGGCFVCKVFDLNSLVSLKLIYLLCVLYEDVYITKPLTSRPANSEKYLVAKNFKGVDEGYISNLHEIILRWNEYDHRKLYVNDLFKNVLHPKFIFTMNLFNNIMTIQQINHLKKTLQFIKIMQDNQYELDQIGNAINWCNKYGVEINKDCKHYQIYQSQADDTL